MRLIDADKLVQQVESPYTEYPVMIEIRKAIMKMIQEAPTVDAEPVRHGYWFTTWDEYDKDGYVIRTRGICSCCNQYSNVSDYCGNCGAKMILAPRGSKIDGKE